MAVAATHVALLDFGPNIDPRHATAQETADRVGLGPRVDVVELKDPQVRLTAVNAWMRSKVFRNQGKKTRIQFDTGVPRLEQVVLAIALVVGFAIDPATGQTHGAAARGTIASYGKGFERLLNYAFRTGLCHQTTPGLYANGIAWRSDAYGN
jgi:hypothetical protein